jgi:ribosomal-protein-alanine N-acetyltransferase
VTVRLIDLPLSALESLASGDTLAAGEVLGLEIPVDFAAKGWGHFAARLRESSAAIGWNVYAVVRDDIIVGDAGFKGGPDPDGVVEIGYSILPGHRRRGYATAAVRALLEQGATDPRVRVVQACIDPDNSASIAVVTSAGMIQAGEFIHPSDGRQLLFTFHAGN